MGLFSSAGRQSQPPPPLPPPLPPTLPSQLAARTNRAPTTVPSNLPPAGSIGIGIETEFLLDARLSSLSGSSHGEFGQKVAQAYNQQADPSHPRMHCTIDGNYNGEPFREWSLQADTTVLLKSADACKPGIFCFQRLKQC